MKLIGQNKSCSVLNKMEDKIDFNFLFYFMTNATARHIGFLINSFDNFRMREFINNSYE